MNYCTSMALMPSYSGCGPPVIARREAGRGCGRSSARMTGAVVLRGGGLAALLGLSILIRAARSRIIVRVHGDSMLPALRAGDVLVARRYDGRVDIGDIVVF